jgi:hypothetical protein
MKKSVKSQSLEDRIMLHLAFMEKYDNVIAEYEKVRKKKLKALERDQSNHTLRQEIKKIDSLIEKEKILRFELFARLIVYVRNLKNYLANKRPGYSLKNLKTEMNFYLNECEFSKSRTLEKFEKMYKKF